MVNRCEMRYLFAKGIEIHSDLGTAKFTQRLKLLRIFLRPLQQESIRIKRDNMSVALSWYNSFGSFASTDSALSDISTGEEHEGSYHY